CWKPDGAAVSPKSGRSRATARVTAPAAGTSRAQSCADPGFPCTNTTASPWSGGPADSRRTSTVPTRTRLMPADCSAPGAGGGAPRPPSAAMGPTHPRRVSRPPRAPSQPVAYVDRHGSGEHGRHRALGSDVTSAERLESRGQPGVSCRGREQQALNGAEAPPGGVVVDQRRVAGQLSTKTLPVTLQPALDRL